MMNQPTHPSFPQDIIPFGNNPVFRYLFGWMMPPRISLLKLTQTEALRKMYEEHHVVQDMLVPVKDLAESMDVFEEVFNVYPLWLCPMRIPRNPNYEQYGGFIRPLPDGDEMFVDVGAYGNPSMPGFNAVSACRKAEDFVREKKGYQMMYADSCKFSSLPSLLFECVCILFICPPTHPPTHPHPPTFLQT